MVQIPLRRAHRLRAIILASPIKKLRPQPTERTPTAWHTNDEYTNAEASEEANASSAVANVSENKILPIPTSLLRTSDTNPALISVSTQWGPSVTDWGPAGWHRRRLHTASGQRGERVVNSSFRVKTVPELIANAKANPGKRCPLAFVPPSRPPKSRIPSSATSSSSRCGAEQRKPLEKTRRG